MYSHVPSSIIHEKVSRRCIEIKDWSKILVVAKAPEEGMLTTYCETENNLLEEDATDDIITKPHAEIIKCT